MREISGRDIIHSLLQIEGEIEGESEIVEKEKKERGMKMERKSGGK